MTFAMLQHIAVAVACVAAPAAQQPAPAQDPAKAATAPAAPATRPRPTGPAAPAAPAAGGPQEPARPPGYPGVPGPPRPDPGAPAPLTLEEAEALALKEPSESARAELEARAAEEDVNQARAAFLPVVSLPLAYVFTSPMRGPEADGLAFADRPPAFIANDAVNEFFLLGSMTGTVDISGGLRAALDRARAQAARARAQAAVARNGVLAAVDDAYYALALARGRRAAAEETLRAARDFRHITEIRVDAGESAEVDAVRARADVAAREDELLQARAAEEDAADTLRALVGYPFDRPVEVADLGLALPRDGEIAAFTTGAWAGRPEVASFAADAAQAEAEARQARAERRPSLSYAVTAGVNDSTIRPQRDLGVSASVSLNVPLLDWGASRSRERQAEIRGEQARVASRLAERQFERAFAAARSTAVLAAERVRVAAAGVGEASRALEISVARYQAGEAPVTEVMDARAALSDRRGAFYQALYDYHSALTRLRRGPSGQQP